MYEQFDERYLTELFRRYTEVGAHKRDTFLNVIHKGKKEELVSALIAYLLENDAGLIERLIDSYPSPERIPDHDPAAAVVTTEKQMGSGRADIFIEIPSSEEDCDGITITIENKIDTWEHDDQTKKYCEWVTKHYRRHRNIFWFLRPDYNPSPISCRQFADIRYSDFNAMISSTENHIILDLKDHIEQELVHEMSFNDCEKDIVEHYNEINHMLKTVIDKVNRRKDDIIGKIEKEIKVGTGLEIQEWKDAENVSDNVLLRHTVNFCGGLESYRLYRPQWYEKEKYYFFVEIKFHNDTEFPFYITFQETIKGYANSREDISDFVGQRLVEESGLLFVIDKVQFESTHEWTSPEWEDELIERAVNYLTAAIEDMNKVFSDYLEYRGSKNTETV